MTEARHNPFLGPGPWEPKRLCPSAFNGRSINERTVITPLVSMWDDKAWD